MKIIRSYNKYARHKTTKKGARTAMPDIEQQRKGARTTMPDIKQQVKRARKPIVVEKFIIL